MYKILRDDVNDCWVMDTSRHLDDCLSYPCIGASGPWDFNQFNTDPTYFDANYSPYHLALPKEYAS